MKRIILSLIFACGLAASPALAHGGVYGGPGDIVPPGTARPSSPTTPTTPTTPTAPTSPTTPSHPATPSNPTTPVTPVAPPTPQPPSNPITPGNAMGNDLTRWEHWWAFNQAPYLNLKAKVHSAGVATGEGEILRGISAQGATSQSLSPSPQQIRKQVIPALQDLLANERNRDLAGASMMALGKIQLDASALQAMKYHLRSADQEVAETAALSLGVLQSAEALPILLALAVDSDDGRQLTGEPNGVPARTRCFALYGLGLLGSRAEELAIREQIAATLWRVLREDDSAYKDLRVAAAICLGVVRFNEPEQAIADLREFMLDGRRDTLVRAHCPNAIAKIANRNQHSPSVRAQMASFTEDLLKLAAGRRTENGMRQSAVYALGLLDASAADFPAEACWKGIKQAANQAKDRQTRRFAAMSMAHFARDLPMDSPLRELAVKEMLNGMRTGKGGYQAWSGLALGVYSFHTFESGGAPSQQVIRALHQSFEAESNSQRRGALAIALGLARAESAAESIAEALHGSKDAEFRGHCCVALGLLDARAHAASLRELVQASLRQPALLRSAAIGLGLMRDKHTGPILVELIQPANGSRQRLAVLSAAATALGFIGDRDSVQTLLEAAQNQKATPLGRAFAVAALGSVCEAQTLPWSSVFSTDLNYRASVHTLVGGGAGLLEIH